MRVTAYWRWMRGAGLGLCLLAARGESWPEYRGPRHDGISRETILTDWNAHPPKLLWRKPLDPALSSLSIQDGRVYTQVRRRAGGAEREFCVALDAETGAELWAADVGKAEYPHGGVGSDDGPRSTPSVRDGRVFVFSSYLRLVCLDAATGVEQWRLDMVEEFGSHVIAWENAASPLLVGDLILANSNARSAALLAVRQEDGSVVWRLHDERMTQATPVTATWDGVPQVVFFAQSGMVSVRPENGELLWRYSFPYSVSTAASPVVAEGGIYCSAAYGKGAGFARITRDGDAFTASQVWRTPGDNMNHWATPVYYQGHFYGIYGQNSVRLECLEAETGATQWVQGGVGRGGVLMVSDHLLVLTEQGEIRLVRPNPGQYDEVARFSAVNGKCWNVPAFSNGRLYVRSTTEAACYQMAVPELPPLVLRARPRGAGIVVEAAAVDDSPLDEDRGARIQLYTSTNVVNAPEDWRPWPAPPVWENGRLKWEAPLSPATPRRFFQTRENR